MINISQLTQFMDIDSKLLNSIENGELELTDELDFDQFLQGLIQEDVNPAIKAQPKVADDGQFFAADDSVNNELDGLPGTLLEPSQTIAWDGDKSSTNLVNLAPGATIKMHDIVIPPLHQLGQQTESMNTVALKSVTGLQTADPMMAPQETIDKIATDLKLDNNAVDPSDESTALKLQLQASQEDVSLRDNANKKLVEKLDSNLIMEKATNEKIGSLVPLMDTKDNRPQARTKASLSVDGVTLTQSHQSATHKLTQQAFQVNQALQETMQTPLKIDDTWGKNFQERLVMMANNGLEKALIQIDPPELGPLEIKVDMDGPSANLQFTTSQQSVKDLIENQVTQLREAFEASGLNLVDVNVEHQQDSQWGQNEQLAQEQRPPHVEEGAGPSRQDYDGLLDIYV